MAKLSDSEIRNWIKSNEYFEMRGDVEGLYLSYRKNFSTPIWCFRYRFVGKSRIMNIGSYQHLSLADEFFQNRVLGSEKKEATSRTYKAIATLETQRGG